MQPRTRQLTDPAEIAASDAFSAALKGSKFTQSGFGAELNVTQGMVWQWANRRAAIPAEHAVKVGALLNVPAATISAEWRRLNIDAPVTPPSQPARLDPTMLAESIAALRQVAKRHRWDYDPETHAEITCHVYELRAAMPAQPSSADAIDFGARVAERLQREMANERSEGGQSSSAAIGSDDRGRDAASGRKARAAGGAG